MKTRSFIFLFIAICCRLLFGQSGNDQFSQKYVNPVFTHEVINIDGYLNEQPWLTSESIEDFIQSGPCEGEIGSEKTSFKVLIDEAYIYIGATCFHSESSRILNKLSTRDNGSGDRITIYLSGTGDNETGYYFKVNSAGVQSDGLIMDDGRRSEFTWDGVWFSNVHMDSIGWYVEVKIPLASVMSKPQAKWKISFSRYIARKDERLYWPSIKQQQGFRVTGMAELNNVAPVKSNRVEVYPVVLMRYDKFNEKKISINGGLDASWSLSSNIRIDCAANPDFAQIEADPYRINISRIETYFTEKRQFFINSIDKYRTPMQLFYSRRTGKILYDGSIVPIIGALKFTLSSERYDISSINAFCGKKDYFNRLGDSTHEDQTYYSIVRIKRRLGDNSLVGILGSDVETAFSFNRVLGLDGTWRRPELEWNNQIAFSKEVSTSVGFAYKTVLNWQSRTFLVSSSSEKYSTTFNANKLGYIAFNGEKHNLLFGPIYRFDGTLSSLTINSGGNLNKYVEDPGYSRVFELFIMPVFRNWSFSIDAQYAYKYEMDNWYNSWFYDICIWRNTEGNFSIEPEFQYCTRAYNYRKQFFAPYGDISIISSYRPRSNVEIAWQGKNTLEWDPTGRLQETTWGNEFWYRWTFVRDVDFKTYVAPNITDHIHHINILLSYNYSPKSWIFLAFNEALDNTLGYYRTTDRVVVVKLSRLF